MKVFVITKDGPEWSELEPIGYTTFKKAEDKMEELNHSLNSNIVTDRLSLYVVRTVTIK